MNDQTAKALHTFLATWEEGEERNKSGFIRLQNLLLAKEGIQLEFLPRPGVTYSLRASQPGHGRPLFVMIDVIEDQPRWMSICFFGDMITDPDQLGAFVPGGLLGEDALCFDLEICTEAALHYVEARIEEAWRVAAQG